MARRSKTETSAQSVPQWLEERLLDAIRRGRFQPAPDLGRGVDAAFIAAAYSCGMIAKGATFSGSDFRIRDPLRDGVEWKRPDNQNYHPAMRFGRLLGLAVTLEPSGAALFEMR